MDVTVVYRSTEAADINTVTSAGEDELRLVLEVTVHNQVDWDALVDEIQGCTPAAAASWGRTSLVPAGFGMQRLQLEITLRLNELSEESLLALIRDRRGDISVKVEQRVPVADQTSVPAACPAYWFQDVWPTLKGREVELGMLDFIQQPGETIFVPHGWHHIVLNLEWTVAITHNFISRATSRPAYEQLQISDPSSANSWHRLLSAENEILASSLLAAGADEVRTCGDLSSDGERSDDEPHDPIHHGCGDVHAGDKRRAATSAARTQVSHAAPPPPPPLPEHY